MNFDQFEQRVLRKLTAGAAWQRFEADVVPWWLSTDPTIGVAKYWPWLKWPDRRRHAFLGRDIGIDGVAETQQGDLWAVQIKYSDSPDKQLPWQELATFLGLAARPVRRVFARRVIVTNTWRPNATLETVLRANADTLWLGREALVDSAVDWSGLLHRRVARTRPQPRPHQREAVRAAVRALSNGGRAQLHLPCGTGKTLVGALIHEALRSRLTLVLVPTLSLAKQILRDWTLTRTRDFVAMTVCSDQTVADDDALVEVAADLGIPTTTDPASIAAFMRGGTRQTRVVFSTYQSSPAIAGAQRQRGVPEFELVVCDEAHRTAGGARGPFSTVLDEGRIRAHRRLFMTATPRILGANVKAQAALQDFEVVSMDDVSVYGPVVYEMSFGEAVDRKLLCDYRVAVAIASTPEVEEAVRKRRLVAVGARTRNAEELAAQIALGHSLRKYGLRKLITFHSRVRAAAAFAGGEDDLGSTLGRVGLRPKRLSTLHVSGDMPAGERAMLLHEFRAAPPVALISNARCLTEGIDVPATDAVVFMDPRTSRVDIVQAVGRAMRLSPGKSVGTILIPLVIPPGQSAEDTLASSRFAAIADGCRSSATGRKLIDSRELVAEGLSGMIVSG